MRQFIFTLLVLCASATYADNIKRPDSYNYTRGVEAINKNNTEEALEYLNKEITEHPDNGYAFAWIALVRNYNEEFGRALTASNVAVKKIPAKDKEYKAFAYSTRAKVYLNLEDTIQALKDYGVAINTTPEDTRLYNARAQVYFDQEKYDLADMDYQKMISLNEGDVTGYLGIGRNADAQKRYEDAIKQFDYAAKLDQSNSLVYSYRAGSYIEMKKYNEAIDDVIMSLYIDGNTYAFYQMQLLADSAFDATVAKLKAQKIREPNENTWAYYLGAAYENADKHKKAIDYYKESYEKESNPIVAQRIATCYNELADYDRALEYCNQAIALDSTDADYLYLKANILDFAGRSKEAMRTINDYIAKKPDEIDGYALRGWFRGYDGDFDGAIEDYTMVITMQPKYASAYFYRGGYYRLKGEMAKAEADYKEVVRLDSISERTNGSIFAYYYLGQKDKAIQVLDKQLDKDRKANSYDAACLYSMMGEKEKALSCLRQSLEGGYRHFAHIKRDRDLDNIRNSTEFKALIKEYEEKLQQEIASEGEDDSAYETKVEEIPFTKEGGVCKVKCSINGLPLHFIFDTGAADVSLSSVEASFMAKNDYLSSSDIIGKQNYMTADGNITEGTVVNLRDVKFGTLHLNNIKASVTRNQVAPLLLGQSVLSKLGKIEIDNDKKVLRITHKQKINQ